MPITEKRLRVIAAAIGERLAARRRAAGLTQAELAARVGSTPVVISRIETGRQHASLQRLIEIADVLGCELGDLIVTVVAKGDEREAVIAEIGEVLRGRPVEEARRALEVVRALVR